MKKLKLTFLLLCTLPLTLPARKVTLKSPLSGADYTYLEAQAKSYFGYEMTVGFYFNTDDFYDNKKKQFEISIQH